MAPKLNPQYVSDYIEGLFLELERRGFVPESTEGLNAILKALHQAYHGPMNHITIPYKHHCRICIWQSDNGYYFSIYRTSDGDSVLVFDVNWKEFPTLDGAISKAKEVIDLCIWDNAPMLSASDE